MKELSVPTVTKDMTGLSKEAAAKYCLSSQFETADNDVLYTALTLLALNVLTDLPPFMESEDN